MITELQIAKENVSNIKVSREGIKLKDDNIEYHRECLVGEREKAESHKASCQRFLDFLEDSWFCKELSNEGVEEYVQKKITDLKNAIKEYEDNGI